MVRFRPWPPFTLPETSEGFQPSPVLKRIETIAREWFVLQAPRIGAGTFAREMNQPERCIFLELGARVIKLITPPEVLGALRRVEARGIHDTAHRTRSACSRIFRFAVATGRAGRDVTADLRGALAPVQRRHLAATIDPTRIGELLRAIDGYVGQTTTHAAL